MVNNSLIAPCGMNCGICLAYLREKNHCNDCREWSMNKSEYCRKCIIVNCDLLSKTDSKCCYDCEKYPGRRLKQLDNRYRRKYHMSMLENLETIRKSGLERFMLLEKERRTCPACGVVLCVHRS